MTVSGGALLASVRAALQINDAAAARRFASRHAGLVLMMLGLGSAEAREIATRPLTHVP